MVLATGGYHVRRVWMPGARSSARPRSGVTGLAFLGLDMLAGELTATSRAANGIGVVLVLGAYALRGGRGRARHARTSPT